MMKAWRVRGTCVLLACTVIASAGQLASAQPASTTANGGAPVLNPAPSVVAQPISPREGAGLAAPVWRPDANQAGLPTTPGHPPIDQIPSAMADALEADLPRLPAISDMVLLYDAATGQTQELPVGLAGDLPPELSVPAFTGPGEVAQPGYDDRGMGTMVAVAGGNLSTFPYSANCKLVMRFVNNVGANQYFVCSGTMIDGGVVLTAAHCVFNRAAAINAWAAEVWVYPGWDGVADASNTGDSTVVETWGFAKGVQMLAGADYINNGNWDRDVAAIRLDRGSTRNVGMITGSYGYGYGHCNGSDIWSNFSYPSETCGGGMHTGAQMYSWRGTIDSCPGLFSNQYDITTTAGCLTAVWGGMSGSGMALNASKVAYAVCSTSNRSTQGRYCGLWSQVYTDIGAMITAQRGATFDIEPLRFRFAGGNAFTAGQASTPATVSVANATNNDPAPRTVVLRVYLSDNNDIDAGDTLLATYTYENVDFAPMQVRTFNVPPVTIPVNAPVGAKWVGCILDPATDFNVANNDTDTWDATRVTINPCVAPQPVAALTATFNDCNSIFVSWAAAPTATAYWVYRNTVNDLVTSTMVYQGAAPSFHDITAPLETDFYYWCFAQNACGYSVVAGPIIGRRIPSPGVSNVRASDGELCGPVRVTWTSPFGVHDVAVYRAIDASGTGMTAIGSGSAGSFDDWTATPGVQYYYWIQGYGLCGWTLLSGPDAGLRSDVPAGVWDVSASDGGGCGGILLTWSHVPGALGYWVYRAQGYTTQDAVFITTTEQPGYLDGDVIDFEVYTYFVVPFNNCGRAPVGQANFDQGYNAAGSGAEVPTNVQASDDNCFAIEISWNPTAAYSYAVYREEVGMPGSLIQLGISIYPGFTDSSGVAGVTYFYAVSSLGPCGESELSTPDVGSLGAGIIPAPADVTAGPGPSCGSLLINWSEVPGAFGYRILRSSYPIVETAYFIGESGGATSFIDWGVSPGGQYYWIVAQTSCGDSAPAGPALGISTGEVTINTPLYDQSAPEGSTAIFFADVTSAMAYQWFGPFGPLSDRDGLSGSQSPTLIIASVTLADAGPYTCLAIGECSSVIVGPALLTVNGTNPCPADFNQDGGVDGADVDAFFFAWEQGESSADVNLDGGVDGSDIDAFFFAWENGGC